MVLKGGEVLILKRQIFAFGHTVRAIAHPILRKAEACLFARNLIGVGAMRYKTIGSTLIVNAELDRDLIGVVDREGVALIGQRAIAVEWSLHRAIHGKAVNSFRLLYPSPYRAVGEGDGDRRGLDQGLTVMAETPSEFRGKGDRQLEFPVGGTHGERRFLAKGGMNEQDAEKQKIPSFHTLIFLR